MKYEKRDATWKLFSAVYSRCVHAHTKHCAHGIYMRLYCHLLVVHYNFLHHHHPVTLMPLWHNWCLPLSSHFNKCFIMYTFQTIIVTVSFNKHFSQTRGTKIQSFVCSTVVYMRISCFIVAYFPIIISHVPAMSMSCLSVVFFLLNENQMFETCVAFLVIKCLNISTDVLYVIVE